MSTKVKVFLVFLLLIPCLGIGRLGGSDLNVYRMAGALAAQGTPLLAYENSALIGNYFDGPPFLAFAQILAKMSYVQAKWFWLGVQTLAYVLFWVSLFKLFPGLLSPRSRWAFLGVWVASIKPIHASFQSFNVQLIIASALLLSEVWSRSPKRSLQFLSGIPLSILSLWKVYPAFIWVYFLLSKSAITRAGLWAGVSLGLAIPLLAFGMVDGALSFPLFIKGLVSYHAAFPLGKQVVSLSLPSLIARWFDFLSPLVLSRIISVVVLSGSAAFFYRVWKTRRTGHEVGFESDWFALALALMVFLNNGSRPDYFVFYVPAFAVLALWGSQASVSWVYRAGFGVALGLIAFISEWTLGSRELTHELEAIRVPVLGMIVLCALIWRGTSVFRAHGDAGVAA